MHTTTSSITNPYIGPRFFEEKEQHLFFGRDQECWELLDLLISRRIVLLYSCSGAGKTSLIQAALIPKIKQEEPLFTILPRIRVGLNPQGNEAQSNRYLMSVFTSLENKHGSAAHGSKTNFETMTLLEYFKHLSKEFTNTLLIFDQFEEIFTLDPIDLDAKEAFFSQLGEVLETEHCWALFSMREEYIASLDPYRQLIPYKFNNTFRLELLNEEAAHVAIQNPARAQNVEFLDDASTYLIKELQKIQPRHIGSKLEPLYSPFVEPLLLQLACRRIWEEHPSTSKHITRADVSQNNYVDQALSLFYGRCIQSAAMVSQIPEVQIRDWCEQRLITPLQTRNLVLQEDEMTGGLSNLAVKELENQHLLRAEHLANNIWYELIHDRFIEPIYESNRVQILKTSRDSFSKDKLNQWIHNKTNELSRGRRLAEWAKEPIEKFMSKFPPMSQEEEQLDKYNVHVLFACQILDGHINLAYQTIPEIYALLEDMWLTDVKRFKAYFIWEQKSGRLDPEHTINFYYQACADIRKRLVDPNIKAPLSSFEHVWKYLQAMYLSENGRLDKEKSTVQALIKRKADYLGVMIGRSDAELNQTHASAYMEHFYENIVPAIVKNNSKQIMDVLQALVFSERNGYRIINCFEAALVIYYFPQKVIQDFWQQSNTIKFETL